MNIKNMEMQTIQIELTNDSSFQALKELENKKLIRIINKPTHKSYSLPGEGMSEDDFRNWIALAEEAPSVEFNQAKMRWNTQSEKLKKYIR
jgi:hypothetical protein